MTKTITILNIYLTNLGKYNEGELIGEWVELPANAEELEAVKKRIGINSEYEEYFITDFETDLDIPVAEFSSLEKLNEYAAQLSEMDEYELKCFRFLMANGYAINEALEEYKNVMIYSDCYNNYDFGYAYAEEVGLLDGKDELLQRYFDYEAFGRDLCFDGLVDEIDGDYYVLWS